jgi:hypothetical protein
MCAAAAIAVARAVAAAVAAAVIATISFHSSPPFLRSLERLMLMASDCIAISLVRTLGVVRHKRCTIEYAPMKTSRQRSWLSAMRTLEKAKFCGVLKDNR